MIILVKPDDYMAWNNIGSLYIYKGKIDKALECYEKAVLKEGFDVFSLFGCLW